MTFTLIVAVKILDKSLFAVADDDETIPKGLGELEQLTHLRPSAGVSGPVSEKHLAHEKPKYHVLKWNILPR